MWNREFRHLRLWFEVERVCAVIVCDGGLRGDENLKSFRQAKNFGLASLPLFLSTACLPSCLEILCQACSGKLAKKVQDAESSQIKRITDYKDCEKCNNS